MAGYTRHHSFNSRPSCDGRPALAAKMGAYDKFQFTPVLRRATQLCCVAEPLPMFQFTPVLRRATCGRSSTARSTSGFNSRPSCDGRRQTARSSTETQRVSIHARLATGDTGSFVLGPDLRCFNSRPSCDGRPARCRKSRIRTGFNSRPSCDGRRNADMLRAILAMFQFTPVLRRATIVFSHTHRVTQFRFTPVLRRATRRPQTGKQSESFNSRPSCDGRRELGRGGLARGRVSIHARLATGDRRPTNSIHSTKVSIHARLATGDFERGTFAPPASFQFTPVLRRATEDTAYYKHNQ